MMEKAQGSSATSSRGRWYGRVPAAIPLLFGLGFGAAVPLAAQISLTIYNDGRVLVRRVVPVDLPRGASVQRLTLGALDPATLFSSDSGVVIGGVSYDGAVDQMSALRRAVGRRLLFRAGGVSDTVSAVVLGVDPERYQLPDGTVSFSPPGVPRFPVDLVVVDPVTTLSLRSSGARKELRLGYFSAGAQWQASYQVLLGAGPARVSGLAVLRSESLKADNAEVQLLAGTVGRAVAGAPPPRPMMAVSKVAGEEGALAEEKVGEFHLYSLPGRVSLLPGITTSVALFEPAMVKSEKSYVVRGQLPYWGGLPQYGEETEIPVTISYLLSRPRKTELGDRPLPGGVVRIYQADSAGRPQLVGETSIGHTPAGEDLRLEAGQAFDFKARRVQTFYQTRRDSVSAGYWRTSATAEYQVTLSNASDSAATINVLEERGGEWSVLSSSVPAEKLSSTVTRFRVPVPAAGRAVLKYRVKVIW
jgi:hypothetical protein